MSFLTESQLNSIGFLSVGKNVFISDKCSIYNAKNIRIGDNVRIDDFCILSAGTKGIFIGNNVHIACYAALIGSEEIHVSDFAGISSRTIVYSSTDDYVGPFLTNPTVPDLYKNVINKRVEIGRHVVIGAGSIILPGSYLMDFSSVGAMSLINGQVPSFCVFAGIPAKKIKDRDRGIKETEKKYLNEQKDHMS